MQTGEEQYFGEPRRFAEHVLRRLRAERQTADREAEDRRSPPEEAAAG